MENHIKQPPLIEKTIPDHFSSVVEQFGDRPAYVILSISVCFYTIKWLTLLAL